MPLKGVYYRFKKTKNPNKRIRLGLRGKPNDNKKDKVVEVASFEKNNGRWTRSHIRNI